MKYLLLCILSCLSLQSFAATACVEPDTTPSSEIKPSNTIPCTPKINKNDYNISIFKDNTLLWEVEISDTSEMQSKKIDMLKFVTGMHIDSNCPNLFIGKLSYGPMITTKIGNNELSIPQEMYDGLCVHLKPSEELRSPLLSIYNVTIKRK